MRSGCHHVATLLATALSGPSPRELRPTTLSCRSSGRLSRWRRGCGRSCHCITEGSFLGFACQTISGAEESCRKKPIVRKPFRPKHAGGSSRCRKRCQQSGNTICYRPAERPIHPVNGPRPTATSSAARSFSREPSPPLPEPDPPVEERVGPRGEASPPLGKRALHPLPEPLYPFPRAVPRREAAVPGSPVKICPAEAAEPEGSGSETGTARPGTRTPRARGVSLSGGDTRR